MYCAAHAFLLAVRLWSVWLAVGCFLILLPTSRSQGTAFYSTFEASEMQSEELLDIGWKIVDDKVNQNNGPSQWAVSDGKLLQTSSVTHGIFTESAENVNDESSSMYGTKIVHDNLRWVDYKFKVDVKPQSLSGTVSVLFRYQNPRNFYRYVMEYGTFYPKLLKYRDGRQTVLETGAPRYRNFPACTGHCSDAQFTGSNTSQRGDCADQCRLCSSSPTSVLPTTTWRLLATCSCS